MKTFIKKVFLEVLVLAALCVCSAPLVKASIETQNRGKQNDVEISTGGVVFNAASGYDLLGKSVKFPTVGKDAKLAVFVVRASSVETDLNFWSDVSKRIGKSGATHLLGYCDGDACTELRKMDELPFPVMMYSEVASGEALLNADNNGMFLLQTNPKEAPAQVSWRGNVAALENVMARLQK